MMFWKRTRNLESEVGCLRADVNRLNGLYWKLYHKHDRLLAYFKLVEVEQQAAVLLEPKGGPERPEYDKQ